MPGPAMKGREDEDWALADRDAKILIGVMLGLQVAFLLSTMLWF